MLQARTNLATIQSQITAYRQAVTEAINQLSILTGDYPDKLMPLLQDDPLPEAPVTPADIAPGALLARRPDIIAAQEQIAYQAALVGVAKKDFLPTLDINASIATESREFKQLFGKYSLAYSVQPTLTWTIFEGLARNARIAEAKLNLEEMIDSYNLTVMTAVQEVNNALAAYQSVADRVGLEEQRLKYSERVFELQLDRYKQGLVDFSDVADAQADVIDTKNALL